jgi:PPM family protein phosphatase
MNVRSGARTDVGLVREGNEDSYLIDDPLFVVADGMGGHLAGDVASSTAIEVISDEARSASPEDPESLATLVQHANAAIYGKSQGDSALHGMGTTCTLVVVGDHIAQFAHVGDSRAYLLRGGELSQLTEDHTLVNRMVREGRLSAEEADHHPQRNIVTRALGVDAHVTVDTAGVQVHEGDRLLLCSDGLTSMVDGSTIRETLAGEDDPQQAADRLVDLAIQAGGEDNVTVLILDLSNSPKASPVAAGDANTTTGEALPAQDEGGSSPEPEPPSAVAAERSETVIRSDPVGAVGTDFSSGVLRRDVMAPRKRWPRRLGVMLLVLVVLSGGAYFLVRTLLSNSYFVGVNDTEMVTIYRGIPDEIGGLTLRQEERETDLALEDLPSFMQDDLEEGIRADSLDDAEATVSNLMRRAEAFGAEDSSESPQDEDKKKKNN